MAPIKNESSNWSSSNYGEDAVRQANVLASCYLVDATGSLKGFHYCTTGLTGLPSPPSSPPLAAITTSNELTLKPKPKRGSGSRRGGATPRIREGCERFFCETMGAVFLGERNTAVRGSILKPGENKNDNYNRNNYAYGQLTPPPDDDDAFLNYQKGGCDRADVKAGPAAPDVTAWMEVWDYVGGASFRAFVAEDCQSEKSLFVFFDAGVITRDLKQALMALIELAESPLNCAHLVICLDRKIPEAEMKSLTKSLQWIGLELTTLELWSDAVDTTSKEWLFMGMGL